MKKKLITIMVTSLVMIALLGTLLWRMNKMASQLTADEKEILAQELDLKTEDKEVDSLDKGAVLPLYLSGDLKNVVTMDKKSVQEIYNPSKSAIVEEMLTDIKKKGEFTQENPLWAYNPYGTNPDSLYLYFHSQGKCYCRYTISVDKKGVPDFTRTLSNGASGNVTEEHEYQLAGLVPGETNYIILRLYNKKDELAETLSYRVKMPKSKSGAGTMLDLKAGSSKEQLSNGMYTVFQKDVPAVLLYDNSGVLRAEFPTEGYSGRNMEIIYDNIVYACGPDKIAMVNSLGQVMDTLRLTGYRQTGDFAYDGGGNLYVIARQNRGSTGSSKVLKLEVKSGECDLALDMDTLLSQVLEKEAHSKKARKSWVELNSIQVTAPNQILVSSKSLSSVFQISNVNTLLPKIDCIIGDKRLWKDYKKLRKKVLDKAVPESEEEEATPEPTDQVDSVLEDENPPAPEAYVSQYGQNALSYKKVSGGETVQYRLYLLNNNVGKGSSGHSNKSYYDQFLVDVTGKTCTLEDRMPLEKNSTEGNITATGDNFLYARGGRNSFQEMDSKGQTIRRYQIQQSLYRVYKNDWKGFWYY